MNILGRTSPWRVGYPELRRLTSQAVIQAGSKRRAKWAEGTVGLLVVLAWLVTLVPSAHADVMTVGDVMIFTDRTSWLAAVGNGVSTIDFEGIAPSNGQVSFSDLVLSGIHFGPATVADPGLCRAGDSAALWARRCRPTN